MCLLVNESRNMTNLLRDFGSRLRRTHVGLGYPIHLSGIESLFAFTDEVGWPGLSITKDGSVFNIINN